MLRKLTVLLLVVVLAFATACGTTHTYRVSDVGHVAVKDPICQERRLLEEHCEERADDGATSSFGTMVVAGLLIVGMVAVVSVASYQDEPYVHVSGE